MSTNVEVVGKRKTRGKYCYLKLYSSTETSYLYIVTIQYCCSEASCCSCSVRLRCALGARWSSARIFPGQHSLVCPHVCPQCCFFPAVSPLPGWVYDTGILCAPTRWMAHSPTVISECFLLPKSSAQRAQRGRGCSRLLHCNNLFLFFPVATWRAPKKTHAESPVTCSQYNYNMNWSIFCFSARLI